LIKVISFYKYVESNRIIFKYIPIFPLKKSLKLNIDLFSACAMMTSDCN